MTLRGGETPGKETFYLKGGGAVTGHHVKGNFWQSGYWYGTGEHAVKGKFPSLGALKAACQEAKDRKSKRKGWW